MADGASIPGLSCAIQLTLDGEPVDLPPHLQGPLGAIRVHLQLLALRQNRRLVSLALAATGESLNSGTVATVDASVPASVDDPDRLRESRIEAARRVRRQAGLCLERAQPLVLLVLVNDWPAAERAWQVCLPDLRRVLMSLRFLQELWSDEAGTAAFLSGHLAGWLAVWEELSRARARQDALQFSDALEQRLLPWLMLILAHLAALVGEDAPR
jgi:hypothetical protein